MPINYIVYRPLYTVHRVLRSIK